MTFRIAFAGHLQAGKDTAADYLIAKHGARRVKFADRLYLIHDFALKAVDLPPDKDRRLLQIIGTEWGRHRDPLLWCKAFEKDYADAQGNLICTDARFQDERETCEKLGFLVVKIERPWFIRYKTEYLRQKGTREAWSCLDALKTAWTVLKQSRHPSETNMEGYKYRITLQNNGTIEELYAKVDRVLEVYDMALALTAQEAIIGSLGGRALKAEPETE